MFYKLQYKKKKDRIFVDIADLKFTSLLAVKEYLESIREVGIIYRIYSVLCDDTQKKPQLKQLQQKQSQPQQQKQLQPQQPKQKQPQQQKQRKYLNRIHKGP